MNIHEYEDSLEYKIAVRKSLLWDRNALRYRNAKPKIAGGHNPANLTEAEVGVKEGWRLLAEEEIISGQGPRPGIELWLGAIRRWLRGAGGEVESFTYRTRHPAGHFLPKKEEPKKKTTKDWLNELPSGYRERALKNYDPNFRSAHPENLDTAIRFAFRWDESTEGFRFWEDVWNWALDPENPLPPIPLSIGDLPEHQSLEDRVKALEAIVKDLANKEKE